MVFKLKVFILFYKKAFLMLQSKYLLGFLRLLDLSELVALQLHKNIVTCDSLSRHAGFEHGLQLYGNPLHYHYL